jgi:Uma2 family endonuclease
MADAGLFRGQRVELVGGEIVEMAAQKDTHVIGVSLAAKTIVSAFGVGFWVRTQAPLNLGKKDDPEPDVAVVPGSERDYIGSQNRADALLVVEVSDTTLAYDRGRKARRYARAGIGDYWIVNILDQQLEVYRDPVRRGIHFQFGSVKILRRGEAIAPLAVPQSQIRVDDLLP